MNIIYFKTIRYKPTALGNTIQSILNLKTMRAVSILRLHREQKIQSKPAKSEKLNESVEAYKK